MVKNDQQKKIFKNSWNFAYRGVFKVAKNEYAIGFVWMYLEHSNTDVWNLVWRVSQHLETRKIDQHEKSWKTHTNPTQNVKRPAESENEVKYKWIWCHHKDNDVRTYENPVVFE